MAGDINQHDGSAVYQRASTDVVAQFKTDVRLGLSDTEAQRRLALYGKNELASEMPLPAWRKFLAQFQDVLVVLLLIATAVSALLWVYERESEWPYEAITIFAVVLVNAAMGYIQGERAESAVAALRQMAATHAHVLRGGMQREISATEIVLGDIVLVEEGDTIPADARLIKSTALQTMQAAVVYVPVLQRAFSIVSLSFGDWVFCLGVASTALWLREVSKVISRNTSRKAG